MSTTTTARRTYRPDPATLPQRTEPIPCPCGRQCPTLEDLFGHDCPGDIRLSGAHFGGADIDRPARHGDGTGRAARKAERPNRFAGTCAGCQTHVAEGAGFARKGSDGRWFVVCAACTAVTDPAPEAPAPAAQGCKPNRYAGACRHCGGHVDALAGLLCRQDGRWAVEHQGACPDAPSAPVAAPPVDVAAGHYAIPSTGDNDLAFYRVDRPTKGDYAGQVFVKLVVGGHPDRNVRRDHVAGILARIAADPDSAARYGQQLGRCCACNRTLTDKVSRDLGIGPECRSK